jgi:hypothetical protein
MVAVILVIVVGRFADRQPFKSGVSQRSSFYPVGLWVAPSDTFTSFSSCLNLLDNTRLGGV